MRGKGRKREYEIHVRVLYLGARNILGLKYLLSELPPWFRYSVMVPWQRRSQVSVKPARFHVLVNVKGLSLDVKVNVSVLFNQQQQHLLSFLTRSWSPARNNTDVRSTAGDTRTRTRTRTRPKLQFCFWARYIAFTVENSKYLFLPYRGTDTSQTSSRSIHLKYHFD